MFRPSTTMSSRASAIWASWSKCPSMQARLGCQPFFCMAATSGTTQSFTCEKNWS